jgi:acetyl-CoA C-acetyltransferase
MMTVYIAGAVRTPIGKFGGGLAWATAADLGVAVVVEALRRAGIAAAEVDELIFGCARQAGVGPNVARQIAYRAGIPTARPAYTVNMACGSGMKAILLAAQEIALGRAHIVVAGGTESMSRVPYLIERARWGLRLGHDQLTDAMYKDGFLDPLSNLVMGETAEILAEEYEISREQQDAYAWRSQQRAARARQAGRFAEEIVPVSVSDGRGGTRLVSEDEHIRPETTLDGLARLAPVFRPGGTVTAGNSSGITDGAAAVVVLSEEAVARRSAGVAARVVDYEIVGVEPRIMGIGPVPAVRQVLDRQKLTLSDLDLVELNEAFAAQVLACDRELHFDHERLNVNGGAIALGHPIGCSGARIVVTLLYEMARRTARRGLATLCVSGGMGLALLVERP